MSFALEKERTIYFVRDSSKNIKNFEGVEVVEVFVHEHSYFLLDLIRGDEAAFPRTPCVMALLHAKLIVYYFCRAHFLHGAIDSVAIWASHYFAANCIERLGKVKARQVLEVWCS
jgi:hypothetical protein